MLSDKPIHLFHIGTQKAGSTYLYNLLASHSEISLSRYTEVNYFSNQYNQGETWYENSFQQGKYRIDTSPKYFMEGKSVAPRLKEYVNKNQVSPHFLLILRNPIDYLYSHFRMHINHNFFQKHPTKFGIPKKNDIIEFVKNSPDYLKRAQYYSLLKKYWLPHFNLDQFKIVFFEDFISQRNKSINDILNFFQIPEEKLQAKSTSKNQMLRFKSLGKLQNIIIKNTKIKNLLKENKFFNNIYNSLLTSNSSTQLSKETREKLKKYFQEDVNHLEKLINQKISIWKDFQ